MKSILEYQTAMTVGSLKQALEELDENLPIFYFDLENSSIIAIVDIDTNITDRIDLMAISQSNI